MSERPTVTLRVEPSAIPRLRAAYERAADDLLALINDIGNSALIPEPWMGDPVSYAVARLYNARFVTGDSAPVHQLTAYREELLRVRDALTNMEERYRRTEGDNAELWGRLA